MTGTKNVDFSSYKEGYFKGQGNKKIYYRKHKVPNSKKAIVISHGFCESCEKYRELIKIFNTNNYSVYILDHRGHGKSERLGIDKHQINVEKFEYYIEDLKTFIDEIVKKDTGDDKLYLYAHSMGGAIGTLFLQKYDDYFEKAILNAPMMSINTGQYSNNVSRLVASVYCLARRGDEYVWGQGPFVSTPDIISSGTSCEDRYNTYFQKQLKNKCLQTSGASFRWLRESLKASRELIKPQNSSKINIPVLLFQAGKDTFVMPNSQNQFAKYAKNCKIRLFEDAKHEIYIEKDEIFKPYIKEVLEFYDNNLN